MSRIPAFQRQIPRQILLYPCSYSAPSMTKEGLILERISRALDEQAILNARMLEVLEDKTPQGAERLKESKVILETSNSLNSICASYSVVVGLFYTGAEKY